MTTTDESPTVRRYSKAQESRRDRIIEAGYELLLAVPYERIQMKEVSEESGVALATVYRYFSSKEALFAHVLRRWIERFGSRVQHRPLRGSTNADRLTDAFRRAITAFQRMPQFFEAFQIVEGSADAQAREAITSLTAELSNTYADALVGIDSVTVKTVVFAGNATMNNLLRAWSRGVMTLDEVHAQMGLTIALLTRPLDPKN